MRGEIKKAKKLRKNSTPQEVILWSRLRGRKYKNLKFRRQHPIGNYFVDFICLDRKVIIELDGWQHKEINQRKHDEKRSNFLKKQGFKIIRFWNNEINNNLEGVFTKLDELIKY